MNEDKLNLSIRKFLKSAGIQSQRLLEEAARNGPKDGGKVKLCITLSAPDLELHHTTEGIIDLG